jgi:septal ring factor EnvC (AmiA/AmiB activator)
LEKQIASSEEEKIAAEEQNRQIARRVAEAERALTEVMTALDALRGENEERRAAYMRQMRSSAALGNESSSLETQVAAAAAVAQRCRARIAEIERTSDQLDAELA